jgi:hypothetical protein
MSSTAADERPRLRREATREALSEATREALSEETAQTFCLVKSA